MDGWFTVRGIVATRPNHVVTADGMAVTSFRLLAAPASRDASWYTVSAFRELAIAAAGSLQAGDPVLITGRLVVRQLAGPQAGATAEVEAEAIGHELGRERDRGPEQDRSLRDSASPDASPAKDR
ncbi:single-stranded DNA-binding protein [Leifsonia sp. NPDC058194]|uniref:single-stranded DNA-binding protein n=1 Tax=Leifsonia sp. NPDC058194 TaxID=3346374 RepID=UPI0036DF1497